MSMKTARERIESIPIDKANLEYIAKTGKINGSLLASLNKQFVEFARDHIDNYTAELLFRDTPIIDKADKAKSQVK